MRNPASTRPTAAAARHTEALLDDALRMTFPASDPIAPAVATATVAALPIGSARSKPRTAKARAAKPRETEA